MFWGLVRTKSGSAEEAAKLEANPGILKLPNGPAFMASAAYILGEEMGFRRSAEEGKGLFADGEPAPLLSYALLEYLMGLDLSAFDVLEIGGGESTAFWLARAKSVTALETDPQWAETMRARSPGATVEVAEPAALAERIGAFSQSFGVIIIDPAGNRAQCARAAITKLAAGGFILLDNSDWYPNASRILRESGLIQVDFHDFRPAHAYRATASLFLSPEFRPVPRRDRLPLTPIGGKQVVNVNWDTE